MNRLSVFLRLPALALAAVLLASQALATWSIVVIKRSTGEVCVASATCIEDFPLIKWLPVIVVGKGAAAAQSFIDTGTNRLKIRDGFLAGWTPGRILEQLQATDSAHQTRQYGIVSFDGPPVTFTGLQAGDAKFGVIRDNGDMVYAIQGNVLTGAEVVYAAEQALLHTDGDLGQKAMAAMQAARSFGGDGRCSCSTGAPDSCGAPPPVFQKSAHTAFIIIARPGDIDGGCGMSIGCASGTYYLREIARGPASEPDPMIELQRKFDGWRLLRGNQPDHVLSMKLVSAQRLVADGQASAEVTIVLRNLEGEPLTQGGQVLTITQTNPGPPVALPGPIVDNGDGTHSFSLTATTDAGPGSWQIDVLDGTESVRLFPDLALEVDPIADLHVGYDAVSVSEAPHVPFHLNLGSADAGRAYQVLGSASGTVPGTAWPGGGTLPLNDDRLLNFTLISPGPPAFPGSLGNLDVNGRGAATLQLGTSLLSPFLGGHFDFCAVLSGNPDEFTSVVGFDLVP